MPHNNVLSKPAAFKFELVLTTRCNMGCSYCYTRRLRGRDMTQGLIRKALDKFPVTDLVFTGGEPLLRPDLIRYALEHLDFRKRKVRLAVNTNGTLINRRTMDLLKKYDAVVEMSLDGSRENHDRHRRLKNGESTFDIISGNISELKKNSVRVNINYVVMPDVARGAANNLAALVRKFRTSTFFGYVFRREPLRESEAERFVAEAGAFADIYCGEKLYDKGVPLSPFDDLFFAWLNDQSDSEILRQSRCRFDKFCLFPDGKIYLCPACLVVPARIRNKIGIGDLTRNTLLEKKIAFFREQFKLSDLIKKNEALKLTNNLCYLRSRSSAARFLLDIRMKTAILETYRRHFKKLPPEELSRLKMTHAQRTVH